MRLPHCDGTFFLAPIFSQLLAIVKYINKCDVVKQSELNSFVSTHFLSDFYRFVCLLRKFELLLEILNVISEI